MGLLPLHREYDAICGKRNCWYGRLFEARALEEAEGLAVDMFGRATVTWRCLDLALWTRFRVQSRTPVVRRPTNVGNKGPKISALHESQIS